MKGELLESAHCYFGGGTAIVLALEEYRESLDIDFLCESAAGYRELRSAVFDGGIGALFRSPPKQLRDTRMDQYGIRTFLELDGFPIKFEIVREGRIALSGARDAVLGVPVLSRCDLYAEKLLANADRYLDAATLSRDIIDLAMMIRGWGPIPAQAWEKARGAYGTTVDKAYRGAVERIREQDHLRRCVDRMGMERSAVEQVLQAFGETDI
jgi:hypothetical protein